MDWLLAGIAFLIPLGDDFISFGELLSGVKILVILSALVFAHRLLKNHQFMRSPLDVPIFVFFIAFIVSYFQSEDLSALTVIACSVAGYGVLNAIIYNHVSDANTVRKIFNAFLVSAVLVSLLAIAQFVTGRTLISWLGRDELYTTGHSRVVLGTAKNPGAFAAHFLIAIPVAFSMLLSRAGKLHRIIYGSMLTLFAVVLLMTLARGAIVGVFIACLLILLIYVWKKIMSPWQALFGLVVLAVPIGIFTHYHKEYGAEALADKDSAYAIPDKLASNDLRLALLPASFNTFMDHPIFGVGYGMSPGYLPHELTFDIVDKGSHNNFLGISAELGLLGLAPYLLILMLSFRAALASLYFSAGPPDLALSAGLLGAFCAQNVFGLFHANYINVACWLVCSLMVVLAKSLARAESRVMLLPR